MAPQAITINQSDIPEGVGYNFTLSNFDPNAFVLPNLEGENLTWDFSSIPVVDTRVTQPMLAVTDAGSSNYGFFTLDTNTITQQEYEYIVLRELNSQGLFDTGLEYTQELNLSIFNGAGSLSFVKGIFLESPKPMLIGFPATYGDTFTSTSTKIEDFIFHVMRKGVFTVFEIQ